MLVALLLGSCDQIGLIFSSKASPGMVNLIASVVKHIDDQGAKIRCRCGNEMVAYRAFLLGLLPHTTSILVRKSWRSWSSSGSALRSLNRYASKA